MSPATVEMGSIHPPVSLPGDIQNLISQLTDRLESWLTKGGIETSENIRWKTDSANDELNRHLIGRLEHLKWLLYEPIDYLKELTQGRVCCPFQIHPS